MEQCVDYEKAKREANNIIKKYNIISAPVLINDIIEKYGISIKYKIFPDDKKNISGFIDINEKCIYINYEDNTERQNFTKAHELGHYILHRDIFKKNPEKQILLRKENENNTQEEKEANCFAAEILIPRDILLEKIGELKRNGSTLSVNNLATMFYVSNSCMSNRINSIGW